MQEMEKYLACKDRVRKLETEMTNKFIKTRCEISCKKYNKKIHLLRWWGSSGGYSNGIKNEAHRLTVQKPSPVGFFVCF